MNAYLTTADLNNISTGKVLGQQYTTVVLADRMTVRVVTVSQAWNAPEGTYAHVSPLAWRWEDVESVIVAQGTLTKAVDYLRAEMAAWGELVMTHQPA